MRLRLPALLLLASANAFSFQVNSNNCQQLVKENVERRREFLQNSAAAVVTAFGMTSFPADVLASGGATAGKYTTIPIAKRRYYGRVQEAVHEFLELGPVMVKADMTDPKIQKFFDVKGTVVVEARNQAINGQCTKKDTTCKGAEIRDSRYNDMKASMYLLGNAFRINQQKAPDSLPTVQAAKKFFKEMDQLEKAVVKKPKTNDKVAVGHYAAALDILDSYLDLVELPPIDSGNYDNEFDTRVGKDARIM
mmetsp:Transcript_9774/g.14526  ORF Transcript_9774/g.14526 Transcript_9774/m.14526 type:complete len:250 (-) Transcript_9774:85-834(-)